VDEVSLQLENVDAFWENSWYPEKGAKLNVQLGYDALMPCGDFEVDEIEINSMPDRVTIKAISAGISGSLRTKKNYGHENTTLQQIVQSVAAANNLTLQGQIDNISFNRLTQHMETDLGFLNRLASQFGYYFSVRGSLLVFTRMFDLMNAASVFEIDRTDCIDYSIKDKSHKVFRKANVKFTSPKDNVVIAFQASLVDKTNADGIPYQVLSSGQGSGAQAPQAPTSTDPPLGGTEFDDSGFTMDEADPQDEMNVNERIENSDQGEAMASAALLENNSNQQELTLKITGNPLLVAGNNFQMTGIGTLTGKYHIVTSEHTIDRNSGYITTITAKRVGFIELTKAARKKTTKQRAYQINIVK
jgi:phage protein D